MPASALALSHVTERERRRRRRARRRREARRRAAAQKAAARRAAARRAAAQRAAAQKAAAQKAAAQKAAAERAAAEKAAQASAGYRPPALPNQREKQLIDRFTFGWTPSLLTDMRAAGGADRWFEQQLQPSTDRADSMLAGNWFPGLAVGGTMKDGPTQWSDHTSGRIRTWEYAGILTEYLLIRRIGSSRQVRERMTDFWVNHLYIPLQEDRSAPWRSGYEELIRSHALGNFADMLVAAVLHPAMTCYLTNYSNTKWGLNENLARELLELHTVGRGAGFTEADVRDSARILTGYKVDLFRTYTTAYKPTDHYTGRVQVLGFSAANTETDGRAVTEAYLRYLATHPSTATRIARKLCLAFVSDEPSAAIVSAVRQAYLSSGGDVKTCLRVLVGHEEFGRSAGQKLRNPVDDLVATLRSTGAVPSNGSTLENRLGRHLLWWSKGTSYRLYSWLRPDGPPLTADAWSEPARMLKSWDIRFKVSDNQWNSAAVRWRSKAESLPTVWPRRLDEVVDHMSRVTLGVAASATEVAAVGDVLGKSGATTFRDAAAVDDQTYKLIRGLLLSSPRHLAC